MRSRFPSVDLPQGALAFDASALINFLGTGMAEVLLANLGQQVVMAPSALGEVKYHPIRGHDLDGTLGKLKDQGMLIEHPLSENAKAIWWDLLGGDLAGGIDDGEAATIALAVEHARDTIVVIDERKATRIFGERWVDRLCVDTVTLLAQVRTRQGIAPEAFADACFSALHHARMRVPDDAVDWLVGIIGHERAAVCRALRQSRLRPR